MKHCGRQVDCIDLGLPLVIRWGQLSLSFQLSWRARKKDSSTTTWIRGEQHGRSVLHKNNKQVILHCTRKSCKLIIDPWWKIKIEPQEKRPWVLTRCFICCYLDLADHPSVCIFLSVVSVCLSDVCLSICLYPHVCSSHCRFVWLSACVSVWMSVRLTVYLSVCLSVGLFVCRNYKNIFNLTMLYAVT